MIIIPALDIIGGKIVRLEQGEYGRKTEFRIDPLAYVRQWMEAGCSRFHIVDLDGAKAGKLVNRELLSAILSIKGAEVQIGGGIRARADASWLLERGASRIVLGSIAAKEPTFVHALLSDILADRIVIAADFRGDRIAVSGWLEDSPLLLTDLITHYYEKGFRNFLCTDIERDGMMTGPSREKYKELMARFPGIFLIASGGIRSVQDLLDLRNDGVPAAIVGRALLQGSITPEEVRALC